MQRKDNWTKENDMLLAEIVIHNIRCGNTQLSAFEEAGKQMERTSAACGFRWNKELRQQYEEEINQAKVERANNKEGKQSKQPSVNVQPTGTPQVKLETKEHPLSQVITMIQDYLQRDNAPSITQQAEIDLLKQVTTERDQTIAALQKELQIANETVLTLKDDYAALLRVLGHARKMGIVESEDVAKIG